MIAGVKPLITEVDPERNHLEVIRFPSDTNFQQAVFMSSIVTKIEADRRLRIPAEWGDEFGPEDEVELVRCEDGILVKPMPKLPLDAALKRKLSMNQPTALDLADMDMDALGW
ncbi:MAG TPA: AbrB/MazE/SpoVT family DNA-binding domain-containing protein [Pirellulales bacterium]